MQALGQLRSEAAFDVVVDSQVALDNIGEVLNDLVCILVEESLQFGHLLVIVEILLILGVKLNKDGLKVLEGLYELLSAPLLGQVRRLLQLVILLHQSVVESGQFILHIVLDVPLLIAHDLEDFGFEFLLTLHLKLLELVKHGVHQRGEDTHVLSRHLLALLNIVLNVAELLLKVVQSLDRARNLLLFALKLLHRPM